MSQVFHEVLHVDAHLAGVASFFPHHKAFRLRKLAVDTAFQGHGVARVLINRAIDTLRERGCDMIWCDARLSAKGFYLRNRFQLEGAVFVKDGLDYVIARRHL